MSPEVIPNITKNYNPQICLQQQDEKISHDVKKKQGLWYKSLKQVGLTKNYKVVI